jgi:uncharacterized YccA/Bax inhibitor family protein
MNPTLSPSVFAIRSEDRSMTLPGFAFKGLVLLFILVLTFSWSWQLRPEGGVGPIMLVSLVIGALVGLVTVFRPQWSPYTAPVYAAAEGVLLGSISVMYEARFGGIVFQAATATLGCLFAMLALYGFRIVKVTDGFMRGVIAATLGVMVVYLIDMVLGFFGVNVPPLHSGGIFGIGISLVVIAIACANLLVDFRIIEDAVDNGAPSYMEWYCAFSVLVTLVWLYLEILRLLSKLSRR